jgi:hypothetical protein
VKAFFDTSVLVGAFYGDHPRHTACLRLLENASKRTHFCAAHAVAELYAVMTRLPVRPRITPEQGLLFVENVRDYFSLITSARPSSSRPRRKRPGAAWAGQDLRPADLEVRGESRRGARQRAEFAGVHAVGGPGAPEEAGDGSLGTFIRCF